MIAYAVLGLALACVSIFLILGISIAAFSAVRVLEPRWARRGYIMMCSNGDIAFKELQKWVAQIHTIGYQQPRDIFGRGSAGP